MTLMPINITRLFVITTIFSLFFSLCLPAYCKEEKPWDRFVAQGPFNFRTQSPLYLLFFMPKAQRATTLKRNQIKLALSMAYANMYQVDSVPGGFSAIFDFESLRTSIDITYGILNWLEIHLEIPECQKYSAYCWLPLLLEHLGVELQ